MWHKPYETFHNLLASIPLQGMPAESRCQTGQMPSFISDGMGFWEGDGVDRKGKTFAAFDGHVIYDITTI